MPFDRLDGDVLLQVFRLTDVYTILSLSRVCKFLRTIASTKHLWLLIVQDLAGRGLIAPGDSWEDLSTDELIEEVRRAVDGPRSWHRGAVATIRRQVTIPLDPEAGGAAQFLHGGKYILLYLDDVRLGVECWQVLPSRQTWTWRSSTHYVSEARFDFSRGELHPLVALVCAPITAFDYDRVIILDVNLETGDSSEMFLFDLPRIPHLPQILGSIFACTLYATSEWNMLLLDWSSRRFIFFPLTPRTQGTALSALIPGHLVLTLPVETSAPDSLRIYSLDSLEQIWQPLDDFDVDDPMVLKGVNFMTLVPPPPSLLSTVYHQFADVHVHESPVRAGTYILVVNAKDLVSKDTLPPPSSLFARLRNRFLTRPVTKKTWINTRTLYRLTLPTPSAPVFHRPTPSPTFRWHAKDYRFFTAVAASGYGIRWASAPESMPIHMGSIIFQRLRQGAFEFPRTLPTAVEGDVHDTRSTALHMSETGVVMLRYPAQVVVYWYR